MMKLAEVQAEQSTAAYKINVQITETVAKFAKLCSVPDDSVKKTRGELINQPRKNVWIFLSC